MGATMQVPAVTLMVGDKIVPASLAEHRIDVIERAGGVTRVEAMGQSVVYADDQKVLIALVNGKLPLRQLAARVLGEAVHPFAVNRLFDLLANPIVEVHHAPPKMLPRWTIVKIKAEGTGDKVYGLGEATCAEGDQFNRKVGIRIAFDRALRAVPR